MVTVVVVAYNSAACLDACLSSVATYLPDSEVIVVDNASSDESVRIARARATRVVECGQNGGFGRACNIGVGAAKGEHVLFLNPDVTLTSVDREALDSILARRPLGLVAGRLVNVNGRLRPERELSESWLGDYLGHTLLMLRPRELRLPLRFRRSTENGWASAALLLAARQEFERVGGFDPRFFLYYEDRDLSARYRSAGLPLRATDALVGTHIGGGSSAMDSLRIEPMGWAFLSWLEYVHIHRGERSAQRAATAGWRTLQALDLGLAAGARLAPDGRVARKRRQVTELRKFLRRQVDAQDRVCPDARRALARALR
jgi:N-acetylglucosaminyl-diphospho-decaprenol L-rhamnosyltransferase